MAEVTTMFKGSPIITKDALNKIKSGDEDTLRKLYMHTKDAIQMILIEIIFEKNGWVLENKEVA